MQCPSNDKLYYVGLLGLKIPLKTGKKEKASVGIFGILVSHV
jgi:hypothetical protein